MTVSIPLFEPYVPDRAFGWFRNRIVTQGEVVAQALRLSLRLEGERQVINLCDDRVNFIISYAAALIAGAASLLPPDRAQLTIRKLYDQYATPICLIDHDDIPDGLRTVHVTLDPPLSESSCAVPCISSAQPAVVLFTSGTTGAPAPTTKTWGALTAGARTLCAELAIESTHDFAVMGTVPPQHMFGLEATVMLPLQAGMMVNANRPLLPADIAATLAAMPGEKWMMTTPMHLRACVKAGIVLPAVHAIVSSTMPLPQPLARAVEVMCGAATHEIYGCSEAGMVAIRRTAVCTEWKFARCIVAGQEDGITWIQGGHVEEPVRLADYLELHDEARFTLHGRIADMVKVAGKRTSLFSLDAELMAINGVVDGAFYHPGRGSSCMSVRLVAFVVAPSLRPEEIQAALRERIDHAFLPRPLHQVDALPRNGNGKLPHEALQALYEQLRVRPADDTRSRP